MGERDTKKATYNLDANLHQRLKLTALEQRREMVQLVEEAITAYLSWNRLTETEKNELKTYELVELRGRGQEVTVDFNSYARTLSDAGIASTIAADLLRHLHQEKHLEVAVYDGAHYRLLSTYAGNDCFYHDGGQLHLRLTIPGRIRFEQLRQRALAEDAQATRTVAPTEDTENLAADLKSLIAEASHPLKLSEFIRAFVEQTSDEINQSGVGDYAVHPSQEAFAKRIASMDAATSRLAQLFAIGCYWADSTQAKTFSKALARVAVRQPPRAGTFYSIWDQVAKYAALRLLYAGGIAAVANESYEVLRLLLMEAKARPSPHEPETALVTALHAEAGFAQDHWKWLPGMERRYTPVSDHLKQTLAPSLREVVASDDELSKTMLLFEIFQGLVYMDLNTTEQSRPWAPPGSYFWQRTDLFDTIQNDIAKLGPKWKPLQAGLFSGSPDRATQLLTQLQEFAGRVRLSRGI